MKLTSRIGLFLGRHLPRGYWRVIRFVANRDPALWDYKIHLTNSTNLVIRADLREPVFTGLLRAGCIPHQRGEDRLFKKLIKMGDRVFDVGANVGYVTMLISEIVGHNGLVIAFEPSVRALRLLERNTANLKNVHRIENAASDGEGATTFFETHSLDTSSLERIDGSHQYRVRTVSLDQAALKWGLPDFVKIDVEGHEHRVLQGMKKMLLADDNPIIMFEALANMSLQTNCEILAKLSRGDYQVWRVLRNGEVGDLEHKFGTSNFIAFPSREKLLLRTVIEKSKRLST